MQQKFSMLRKKLSWMQNFKIDDVNFNLWIRQNLAVETHLNMIWIILMQSSQLLGQITNCIKISKQLYFCAKSFQCWEKKLSLIQNFKNDDVNFNLSIKQNLVWRNSSLYYIYNFNAIIPIASTNNKLYKGIRTT